MNRRRGRPFRRPAAAPWPGAPGLLAVGLLLAACGPAPEKTTARRPSAPDLPHPPVSTYAQRCARCHGPQASFHVEEVAALTTEALAIKVGQMLRSNGGLLPSPADEAAMLAYHHAIARAGGDAPAFASVNNGAAFLAGRATALEGEVSPGTQLWHATPAGEVPVPVADSRWRLAAPATAPLRLIARNGPHQATLDFPRRVTTEMISD